MTQIIQGTTTAILEIGWDFIKAGYAGDFHAIIFKEISLHNNFNESTFTTILKEIANELKSDSILIIEREDFNLKQKSKILSIIYDNKIFESVLFLKNIICDAFGHGKTTCAVIRCSENFISGSTIVSGNVNETLLIEKGCRFLEGKIKEDIVKFNIKTDKGQLFDTKSILETDEHINIFENATKTKIFSYVESECDEIISKIVEMRNKYRINKKNVSNGCIIVSGNMFKYKPFYNFIISKLQSSIPNDFTDFFLRENNLDCTFVGASILASNDKSKIYFITKESFAKIGDNILVQKIF